MVKKSFFVYFRDNPILLPPAIPDSAFNRIILDFSPFFKFFFETIGHFYHEILKLDFIRNLCATANEGFVKKIYGQNLKY